MQLHDFFNKIASTRIIWLAVIIYKPFVVSLSYRQRLLKDVYSFKQAKIKSKSPFFNLLRLIATVCS